MSLHLGVPTGAPNFTSQPTAQIQGWSYAANTSDNPWAYGCVPSAGCFSPFNGTGMIFLPIYLITNNNWASRVITQGESLLVLPSACFTSRPQIVFLHRH